jgi:hypothetical protein
MAMEINTGCSSQLLKRYSNNINVALSNIKYSSIKYGLGTKIGKKNLTLIIHYKINKIQLIFYGKMMMMISFNLG